MVETLRSTGSESLAREIAELERRVEIADRIELCTAKKCPLLDILEELSKSATSRLVQADPDNKTQIIQCQQTAKLFDAVIIEFANRLQAGNAAADELNDIQEEG
jgi:peroxiredoxin family protein